jgi:hypothetical protein
MTVLGLDRGQVTGFNILVETTGIRNVLTIGIELEGADIGKDLTGRPVVFVLI